MQHKLVVIGNGMAPGRALERLFERAPDAYAVTIFNAEPRVNYDRIMLSPVLSGEKTFDEIVIHGDGWYVKHGVTLYKGTKVTTIDRTLRTVTSERGITVGYDKLLIATGSLPIVITVPGHTLPGVLSYRDLDDVQAMLLAAKSRGSAVVIGGGLLGLEAAAGLKEQGMDVTVLHLMPTLMERQLDPAAGQLLQRAVEARGIKVITKANTTAILGAGKVEAVEVDNGVRIPADLVVMAVGIRPNAQIAKEAGLRVRRGIVVDDGMRTSDPNIFALGECAETAGQVFGLVAPLYAMANVVAAQLSGDTASRFLPGATATKLKVTGIDLFSAGDFADGKGREEIVLRDPQRGVYRRLVLQDNRIIGTVMYGDTSDGAWLFDLLREGTDIAAMRETLIFGQSYCGQAGQDQGQDQGQSQGHADAGAIALGPTSAVTALPDDSGTCDPNGNDICKGKFTDAFADPGFKTFDAVCTLANSTASCGCRSTHCQLQDQRCEANHRVRPSCLGTACGHDEMRRFIAAEGLKPIPPSLQPEWQTPCCCTNWHAACGELSPHGNGLPSRGIVYCRWVICQRHNWVIDLKTGENQGGTTGRTCWIATKVAAGRVARAGASLPSSEGE
jgi:nitrite reductase (NADH) large subunit